MAISLELLIRRTSDLKLEFRNNISVTEAKIQIYACISINFWHGHSNNQQRFLSHMAEWKLACCNSLKTHHSGLYELNIVVDIFWIYCERDDLLRTFHGNADDLTADQFADVEQLSETCHTLYTIRHHDAELRQLQYTWVNTLTSASVGLPMALYKCLWLW